MANDWDSNICNEKSGFLFNHACDRTPARECHNCERPICMDHSHGSKQGVVCTTCAKKSQRKQKRSSRQSHYRDDPYFYGGYYYGGGYDRGYHGSSRHDYNDFTEADSESLQDEGDDGFENDMSES
jgi:hypothetical protein